MKGKTHISERISNIEEHLVRASFDLSNIRDYMNNLTNNFTSIVSTIFGGGTDSSVMSRLNYMKNSVKWLNIELENLTMLFDDIDEDIENLENHIKHYGNTECSKRTAPYLNEKFRSKNINSINVLSEEIYDDVGLYSADIVVDGKYGGFIAATTNEAVAIGVPLSEREIIEDVAVEYAIELFGKEREVEEKSCKDK